ncbi:MAG: glycosyltransferase [Planctomycetota bacterium]|nr:glycosyltransferase [Planctomycetota bacterium]
MKILFVNKRILFPTNTGGLIRTLNVVRYLARWHDLTYLCNQQKGEESGAERMRELGLTLETIPWTEVSRAEWRFYRDLAWNLASPDPFNVAKDFDPALRSRAEQLLREGSFDLIVCDFVQMARNVIELPKTAGVLFEHNVEAEIFERHAKTDSGWLRRKFMGYQAAKMRAFEGWAGKQFQRVIAVSERDREQYRQRYGWTHVSTIDTAVDIEYYVPQNVPRIPDSLVFVGSLDWLPNQDGLDWFVNQVWGLVRERVPTAVFRIVGRNPSPAMLALGSHPGVEVIGSVPDTRPWLAESEIVVVPLRIGGGTRLKIFEAMAMGKPVVSTTLGAEGLDVQPDRDIVLADDAERLSQRIIELLKAPALREEIGTSARNLVEEKFSAEAVARQFERICEETVATFRAARESGTGGGH